MALTQALINPCAGGLGETPKSGFSLIPTTFALSQ
jgi:hypothetical protein